MAVARYRMICLVLVVQTSLLVLIFYILLESKNSMLPFGQFQIRFLVCVSEILMHSQNSVAIGPGTATVCFLSVVIIFRNFTVCEL